MAWMPYSLKVTNNMIDLPTVSIGRLDGRISPYISRPLDRRFLFFVSFIVLRSFFCPHQPQKILRTVFQMSLRKIRIPIVQRTKFPSRQETAALGSSATDSQDFLDILRYFPYNRYSISNQYEMLAGWAHFALYFETT